jgi:hypothetical protein
VALGGAPWNDPYILPSLLTSVVVAEAGMRERNLGPHTPAGAFERAARRYQPQLVWQSVSAEIEDARAWRTAAERLAATLAEWGGVLVVGGREAGRLPLPSNPNVHVISTLTELAGFARGMSAGT